MGFLSGSISYTTFAVANGPASVTEELLAKLREGFIKSDGVGSPPEVETGVCGGRHVNDVAISFEENVRADAIIFGLRIDTNRVPADVKRAIKLAEEAAIKNSNAVPFLSKAQRKELKTKVAYEVEQERRTGKHRRSRLIPVVWDTAKSMIYAPATGRTADYLTATIERVTGYSVVTLTPTRIAIAFAENEGTLDALNDLTIPCPLLTRPGFPEPVYPWFKDNPEKRAFLATEFAVYLWYMVSRNSGEVPISDTLSATFLIDRSLDLTCAFEGEAKDTYRATAPHCSPEARQALASGKVPRRFGLTVQGGDLETVSLVLQPETFSVGGLRLPKSDADTLAQAQIDRIDAISQVNDVLWGAYREFLALRLSPEWSETQEKMASWIAEGAESPVAATSVTEESAS